MTTPWAPTGYSPLRHLYQSKVQVLRLSGTFSSGAPSYLWESLPDVLDPALGDPGVLMCRLDLQFTRPGKDALQPIVAGRAPDRTGVIFYDAVAQPYILAGDRFVCLTGPVSGTFELRQVPEAALDYSSAHHMENQVIEVAQTVTGVVFPGGPE